MKLNIEDKAYFQALQDKVIKKIAKTASRVKDGIPYTTQNGIYDDWSTPDKLCWWTNGFWPGILWKMYQATGEICYKEYAQSVEKKLDSVLYGFDTLHHDVGFMWIPSSVENYIQTGNEQSKMRAMLAASTLSARYNLKGKFIRAWNEDKNGWAIIDCMMNIPLLYWASEQSGDNRFKYIAMAHADMVLEKFVRLDGSVYHIVEFDPETGDIVDYPPCQGYDPSGSWSRGQAWAIYGFIQSYHYTKKVKYLEAAKCIAHYFIANVCDDYIPKCDFRQPDSLDLRDSSAGAIAACGLIEIAKTVGESESNCYLNAAINLIKALDSDCTDWEGSESILIKGTGSYDDIPSHHMALIYGDYYFFEAIEKLLVNEGK